jgi:hypothetical protein
MRKINFDVDSLVVESFETEGGGAKDETDAYNSVFTCPRTMCGAACPSGLVQWCEGSYAWTNGQVACLCNGLTGLGCP